MLADFYETLFGWSVDDLNEWQWAALRTGPDGGPDGGISRGERPQVFFYAPGDDLQSTLEHVDTHGGATIVEPWQPSDDLGISIFTDPEGNRVGLRCISSREPAAI